jgi:S1-C subfamily serine protease
MTKRISLIFRQGDRRPKCLRGQDFGPLTPRTRGHSLRSWKMGPSQKSAGTPERSDGPNEVCGAFRPRALCGKIGHDEDTCRKSLLQVLLGGFIGLFVTVMMTGMVSAVYAETQTSDDKTTVTAGQPVAGSTDPVQNSVVKVFATVRFPDPFRPWAKQPPRDVVGSGVVIEGKRILTNAHILTYASQVQVQANQTGDKVSATVGAVAQGIDLAVIKIEDETFFDTHPPLERTNALPQITDAVMAYGYPTGGTSLSITKGIVSRIEFTGYNFPVSGLRVQIDAAINPGNSGGPAVAGGRMIGLVFSHLGGAQNIGYIIPCEEIDLFLQDIADGRYDGKPAMFDEFQTLENPALRSFLKLDRSVEGLVVHQPFGAGSAAVLKEWDVVMKIGDTPIDNQGMVKVDANLRVGFKYLIQKVAKNGKVRLLVHRAGKPMAIDVPVVPTRPLLIQNLKGTYPSYFIYGPLVLSSATAEFIAVLGGSNNFLPALSFAGSPLAKRLGDSPTFDGEEVVVVTSPFLPHKLSKGYGNPALGVVNKVNDIPVKNLRHLIEILRDSRAEFVKFEFALRGGETMVFPRKEMMTATEEILTDNGIRAQGSPDTLAVWNAGPRQ